MIFLSNHIGVRKLEDSLSWFTKDDFPPLAVQGIPLVNSLTSIINLSRLSCLQRVYVFCRGKSALDPVENRRWRLPNGSRAIICIQGARLCFFATSWFVIEHLSRIFFLALLLQSTTRHSGSVLSFQGVKKTSIRKSSTNCTVPLCYLHWTYIEVDMTRCGLARPTEFEVNLIKFTRGPENYASTWSLWTLAAPLSIED